MKKYLSLILAIVLVLGCCACTAKAPTEDTTPATTATNEANVSEETSQTPAQQEPVTLKFYCYAGEQADQQRVFDELNKYFQEKYNTTVDF